MEQTDKAMFLWKVKYGDTGYVLKMLTEKNGLESFIIQGVKGKNKAKVAGLFPLNEVEIEISKGRKGGLNRVTNIRTLSVHMNIRQRIEMSSIAFFIAEVMAKSLQEGERNDQLYAFASASVGLFEHEYSPNFHIDFLMGYSNFLGIRPHDNYEQGFFFDLREGAFLRNRPIHIDYLEPNESSYFYAFLKNDDRQKSTLPNRVRKILLNTMIRYYSIHLEGFGNIKSLSVLESIFND